MRLFGIVVLLLWISGCSATATKKKTTNAEEPWPTVSQWERANAGTRDVAIIVAIEDYAFLPPVIGARQTAKDWERYFRSSRGMRDVFLLTDENAPVEEIERFIDTAVQSAVPDANVWFVFVGHGAATADGSDGLMIGMDAQQTVESIQKRSVSRNAIESKLASGPQAQTIMIVDACFSGRSSDGVALAKGAQPVIAVKPTTVPANVLLFTAAQSNEFAGALPGEDRPAFSYVMLGGLRGWADSDGDQKVTSGELSDYVVSQLRHLPGRKQTPDRVGSGSFELATAFEADPGLHQWMSGTAPPEEPKVAEQPKESKPRVDSDDPSSRAFSYLSPSKFGFASLNWESDLAAFKEVFGVPYEERVENARLTRVLYRRKVGLDSTFVIGEFHSGSLAMLLITLEEKYGTKERNSAYLDWTDLVAEQLGVGRRRFDGQTEALVWELADGTDVFVSMDVESLSITMFNPAHLNLRPDFARPKPEARGYIGGRLGNGVIDGRATGAELIQVFRNGPLQKKGFIVGDMITELDGIPVKTANDALELLSYYHVGMVVQVKLLRFSDGKWGSAHGAVKLVSGAVFQQ